MSSSIGKLQITATANDSAKLCLCTALGAGVLGFGGLLINVLSPDTTNLPGLLWVAGFYLVLGLVELRIAVRVRARNASAPGAPLADVRATDGAHAQTAA